MFAYASNIKDHIKRIRYTLLKNSTPVLAVFSLLINLTFIFLYFSTLSPAATGEAVRTITADALTALGPLPEAWAEHTRTYQEFVFQIGANTDRYGMINESGIDYKMKDLIIKYPAWLEYYRNYRTKIWHRFEVERLAEGKLFPEYQPESSDLIDHALSLQGA